MTIRAGSVVVLRNCTVAGFASPHVVSDEPKPIRVFGWTIPPQGVQPVDPSLLQERGWAKGSGLSWSCACGGAVLDVFPRTVETSLPDIPMEEKRDAPRLAAQLITPDTPAAKNEFPKGVRWEECALGPQLTIDTLGM